MKNKPSKKQMSETFLIGAILSVVGGYLDAYTYIARGGVFANAQTGNIVLFGINIANGNIYKALSYLIPIIAFILGIAVSERVRKFANSVHIHWRQYIIFLEIIIIAVVAFLPSTNNNSYIFDMISNVLISFVCSLQVQSFRKIDGIACATTMCTGNLRSATENILHYRDTKDKKLLKNGLKYYGIILFFIVGAIVSAFITTVMQEKSVIFCGFGLVLVLLLMFIKTKD